MSSISVKTFLEVAPVLPADTSILLRGDHGIGKSQVVRQVAAKLGLQLIDRRLSQMSEGDVIGLPSTDGDVTRFNPVNWYVEACRHPRALFLDEINRATPEVMQAAFQIVLDRELNGMKLHPETRVFAAVNSSAAYTVNEMDPALLDRFWTVDLNPTVEDWITWARGNLPEVVVDFIAQNEKWLDTPKNTDPGKVSTSRRSWERLSKALVTANVVEQPDNPLFYPICMGYVGLEATIDFQAFAKSVEGRFTGEQIVNEYETIRPRLKRLRSQDRWNVALEKAGDYVTANLDDLNPAQERNLKDFATDLSPELRVALWSKLTAKGVEKIDLAKAVHRAMKDMVVEAFKNKDTEPKKTTKAKKGA